MKSSNLSTYKFLIRNIPNKGLLIFGIICSMIGAFSELLVPQLVGHLSNVKELKIILSNKILFLTLLIFFAFVYIIQGLATYLLGRVGSETIKELQMSFVDHSLNLPISQIEKYSAGDMASRLTNDISEVAKIVTVILPQFVIQTIVIVGSLIFLIRINFKLTLILLIFLATFLFVIVPTNKKVEDLYNTHQTYLGDINGIFSQRMRTIKLVKFFLGNDQEKTSFKKKFVDLSHNLTKVIFIISVLNTVASGVMMLLVVGLLLSASLQVSKGIMSFSSLVAFVLYIVQLINPTMEFVNNLSEFSESIEALKRVTQILDISVESIYDGNNNFIINNGSIIFKNVTFGYDNNKSVLNNVNLSIDPKTLVAIVGPSGAGKSTIFSLLSKFYTNYSGKIMIDGTSLDMISAFSIRSQCSYVFQNNGLFSGTIKDNLIYGKNKSATEKDISKALEISGANNFVDDLPEGVYTKLGEDGIGLSEGQKQRLNISRAFISQPKILLLDELTSNLDTVAEDQITKVLKKVSKEFTTIVIAHRLQTILEADRILVLEKDGNIKHFGKHEELLKTSSTYRQMYRDGKL